MGYTLNGTPIPRPQAFDREFIEDAATQVSLTGRVTKDIRNRREIFTLSYEYLSGADYNVLKSIYDLLDIAVFESTESNATISATSVHVELSALSYQKSGADYYSNISLKLIEVT